MRGLKGGGFLLVLGIPLALYCALQIKGVVRADMIVSNPPEDRGATKEKLTADHAKTTAWLNEVRKATTIAGQYRQAGPEDVSRDDMVASAVKTSAARSADLNDLDLFLSDIEAPKFTGKLETQYKKWMEERKELKRDADAVATWLAKPPTINSAADANRAMDTVIGFINQYSSRSKFADKAKAAVWRIRARLAVIDALTALANSQYRTAVQVKLPLESGNNTVKTAVENLKGLKDQIVILKAEVRQADDEKATLDAPLQAAIDAKGVVADECAAREELLDLFAKDDLFTNAAGVAAWLKQVGAQYRKTKDERVRMLIREKLQEFCDAFIPETARLDDDVLVRGKLVPRKDVVIKYQEEAGGAVMRKPLSGDLDGVNEFNLAKKYPGDTTFVVYMGSEEYPKDLKPTPQSQAAVLYNGERKKLADSTTMPKWTAKSVDELKKKCEAQKDLVDLLQTPGGGSVGKEPKIWTRLSGLAAGMVGNADLFESNQ